MAIINPRQDQTIFDMASQLYGDVSYVYKIIADNPGLVNIHPTNLTGFDLSYSVSSERKSVYFSRNSIYLTTGGSTTGSSVEGRSFDDSWDLSFN